MELKETQANPKGKKNHYSDDRLQKLKPLHKTVARELAMGASLRDICEARGLKVSTWRQISTCALFQQEMERVYREIEDEEIDEFVRDPARIELKNARIRAARRVSQEIDNFDKENTGATANTRIAASKLVLEAGGDLRAEEATPTVVINLQESVLKTVMAESSEITRRTPKTFKLEGAEVETGQ